MALSKETAGKIVSVVIQDTNSVEVVHSVYGMLHTGAGIGRNFSMAAANIYTKAFDTGFRWVISQNPRFSSEWLGKWLLETNYEMFDPTNPKIERYLCTGIAAVTSKAIMKAVSSGKLDGVAGAIPESRLQGFDHTATLISLDDQSEYFFDWWKTLNVRNPALFHYDNFLHDREGVSFIKFRGFA